MTPAHNLKISKYVVASPTFHDPVTEESIVVVFSSRSGAKQVVAERDWSALVSADFHQLPGKLLESLCSNCILVPRTQDEFDIVQEENFKAAASYPILYQVIQPTSGCQLGCDYCGQSHGSQKLSPSNISSLITRLTAKLNSGKYRGLEIGWFGAEPLLALDVMRTVSKKLRSIALDLGVQYSSRVVSNGLRLTAQVARELEDLHAVRYVELTLDGSQHFHDQRRNFKKTRASSFDKIIANVTGALAAVVGDLKIGIRCNVDKRNIDGVIPLIRFLHKHQLLARLDRLYFAPVRPWGNDVSDVALPTEEFASRQIVWFAEMARLGSPAPLIPQRTRIVCMTFKPEAELIDAHGERYNCTEVSYVPSYSSGTDVWDRFPSFRDTTLGQISRSSGENVFSLGHIDGSRDYPPAATALKDFYTRVKNYEYPCRSCNMLPTCGGACPKSWLEGGVPCPPEKFNITQRLQLDHLLERCTISDYSEKPSSQMAQE